LATTAAWWRYCARTPTGAPELASESRALALGWGDFATTTIDATALNRDHTLSVRFMAAYDASYRGVVVADDSGSYHLGMAPYSSLGRPALELCVGGVTFTYPLPDAQLTDNDFRAGPPRQRNRRWRSLAVARHGATIVVAYDGNLVATFEVGAQPATGRLRLGRLAQTTGPQDQFYGLIDDVTLWSTGLSDPDLRRLTGADEEDVAPRAARPRAKLDFDAPAPGDAPSLSLGGSARLALVSRGHTASLDQRRLPTPEHRTRLQLPFLPGQVWMPIQGINSELSHHGIAVFAIDFIRVDPSFVADNPRRVPGGSHRASQGQPVLAPGRGSVIALLDTRGDDERSKTGDPSSNFVCVQHEAHEVSCLLHVLAGAEARAGARVGPGDVVARVGRTGAATVHLHFALSDLPESDEPERDSPLVTIPAAFSDYSVSTDFGKTWHHVERGVPAPGEWVRRASP
jgi:hypothetical protein